MNVLDPATPFPYLLYTLAGAGIVAYALPRSINALDQAHRDAYLAHAPARAVAALVFWAIWPLLALLLGVEAIATVVLWVIDLFDDEGGE